LGLRKRDRKLFREKKIYYNVQTERERERERERDSFKEAFRC
jgi:hypothetical protein